LLFAPTSRVGSLIRGTRPRCGKVSSQLWLFLATLAEAVFAARDALDEHRSRLEALRIAEAMADVGGDIKAKPNGSQRTRVRDLAPAALAAYDPL
jgi:hypothetical protein